MGYIVVALLDGAVQGMKTRLLQVGYLPDEAFYIAQAAYLKPNKYAPDSPQPVLVRRKDVSWEVSQAMSLLGKYPMGPEAHRQRILLWEKIFGRGSWHEPIDETEIYPEIAEPSKLQTPIERRAEHKDAESDRLIEELKRKLNGEDPSDDIPGIDPQLRTEEYDFYLPGELGNYDTEYGKSLRQFGVDQLIKRAVGDGLTIVFESIQLEVLNIDLIRGSGQDVPHERLQTHMGLAVHVVATGVETE